MATPTDTPAAPEDAPTTWRTRLRTARWTGAGLRTRILLPFVAMLALATLASVLVAREVLLARLDERIDQELTQEASELRRLARGVDPATGEPFARDVRRIFRVFFERNTPSPGEALLTFVDGEPFLRSRLVVPYRLDRDAELVARWGSLAETERGRVGTPAGPVQYLALPLRAEGDALGVFVVAVFRDVQRGPFDDAILATGAVALAILLVGSVLVWRAAESVLRPVRSVTHTARSITETDFSRRIEVEGDDELAELAATFNAMLGRLERAFSGQRRFLDEIGHELKTPLTIVRGHLELLEADDPAEREQTRRLVLDELERMSRLVEDLLLLAKAEAPDFLRLETVDVGRLTEEVAAKMRALAERSWRVEAAGRGMIVADRQRLTQALMQLADNAWKHTEEGDEIVFGSSVGADAARFWVRDTGPGVPREDRRRIFEPFVRGGPAQGDGVGLGLSIVRAIAEAHGGNVELADDGAGSTFTLVVPLDQPEVRS